MFKMLLADDEPVILKGLRKIINWEEHGFEIVGTGRNGEELWHLTKLHQPDFVLTDISMPRMTGIDYLKKVREVELDVKVLFISAYRDFSYAKDALSYGALGYVIKPINRKDLQDEVNKVKQLLNQEEQFESQSSELALFKENAQKIEEKDLILNFLKNNEALTDIYPLKESLVKQYYSVLNLSIDIKKEQINETWQEHEKRLLFFSVENIITELVKKNNQGFLINQHENECLILYNHSQIEDARNLSKNLINQLQEILGVKGYIGIGGPTEKLNELPQKYNEAVTCTNYYYFIWPKDIIQMNDVKPSQARVTSNNLTEHRQNLFQAIVVEDHDLDEQLITFFDWLYSISGHQRKILISACFTVMKELQDELNNLGIEIGQYEGPDLLEKLYSIETFYELKRFVFNELWNVKNKIGPQMENLQIIVVKEYIEKNYDKNITLESIASLIHLNPYYFSSFFKKHTGMNFKKYLTDYRMKEALNLLLNTDMLVYEIAEKTGYRNVRQFSDVFKKYYGKTPTDYKKIAD